MPMYYKMKMLKGVACGKWSLSLGLSRNWSWSLWQGRLCVWLCVNSYNRQLLLLP